MFKMSEYSFVAAALCLGLAGLIYLAYAISGLRAGTLRRCERVRRSRGCR